MSTLSEVLRGTYGMLGLAQTYLATGGSTTTAVVGTFSDEETPPEDDYAVGWTLFVDEADAAAPEGEFGRVSDYAAGTYTFTCATLTAAIAAGDRIMLCRPTIPLGEMIRCVNMALNELEPITLTSSSTTFVSSTYSYTLPANCVDVVSVECIETGDTVRFPLAGWKVIPPATTSGTATLYLDNPPDGTGYITYNGIHTAVNAYSDVVSPTVPLQLIIAQTAHNALRYVSQNSPLWQEKYSIVIGELNAAKNVKSVKKPARRYPILDLN